LADQFNEAAQVAKEYGHRISVHNHWFEFEPVNGKPAYQILLQYLSSDVLFEIDLYWVKTAGRDPAQVLAELGPRVPLVHVKDGPADKVESAMVAVGQGSLDFPAIFRAGAPYSEVHIVELDRCDTDMLTAVAESYQYLTSNGYSTGKK
jgi:sugar phosphate isomerase/epimerase